MKRGSQPTPISPSEYKERNPTNPVSVKAGPAQISHDRRRATKQRDSGPARRQPQGESARRRSGPLPPRRTSPTLEIRTASLDAIATDNSAYALPRDSDGQLSLRLAAV